MQGLNARRGAVDDSREGIAILFLPAFAQLEFRLLDRKPSAIPIGLLRLREPEDFAEVGTDGNVSGSLPKPLRTRPLGTRPLGIRPLGRRLRRLLAAQVANKRRVFDPTVNSRFLESFNRRRLSVGQAWLGATFGKGPAPAAAGLDQQKLDRSFSQPIANRCNLFAFAQFDEARNL